MSQTTLDIQPRELGGSPVARHLRRQGLVPGVLYGRGREPLAFQVEQPRLRAALSGDAGRHAVLQLTIPGESGPVPAILKDHQVDPVRGIVTHVDLLAVSMTERIVAPVALHVEGEAPGAAEGGVLDVTLTEIEVEALPGDLPDAIVVDVSGLHVGDSLKVADLEAPAGVTLASDPDTVVATVVGSTTAQDLEAVDDDLAADTAQEAELGGRQAAADAQFAEDVSAGDGSPTDGQG